MSGQRDATCENCGAAMELVRGRDYFCCPYCGSFAFPERSDDGLVVLGEAAELACPICSQPLTTASVSEVRVLHCPACRRVLVRQESFSTLVKLIRAEATVHLDPLRPLNRQELEREIACPSCGAVMDTHPYYGPGNVVIDHCTRCRLIWLDYGELAEIRDAPGRDREGGSRPGYGLIDDLLGR